MSLSKFAARRRGFTLIELLIVIVVIAILSLIVIPKLMGASRKAKDSTLKANLHIIRNAIEQFQADTGMYPADLDQLYVTEDDTTKAQGYNAAAATPADTDVPTGTYKGPYLRPDGNIIGTSSIPVNPYATNGDSAGTVTYHWAYDETTGTVKPVGTGTALSATDTDAEGKLYKDY